MYTVPDSLQRPEQAGRSTSFKTPLLSWDIYMARYQSLLIAGDDIRQLQKLATDLGWQHEWNFAEKICTQGKAVIVTDPALSIIFATCNVFDMTGYTAAELTGKHPSLLQGEHTCAYTRETIRAAIRSSQPFEATILNYRKNGTRYRCHIEAYPVWNKQQQLTHFIAFEQTIPHI